MSTIDAQSELIEGRWGTHPTEKRKAELEEMLRGWEASSNYSNRRNPFDGKWKAWSNEAWSNHDNRRGPFDGKVLSGSDVFWLVIHLARSTNKVEVERLVRAPLAPPVNTSEYVDLSTYRSRKLEVSSRAPRPLHVAFVADTLLHIGSAAG